MKRHHPHYVPVCTCRFCARERAGRRRDLLVVVLAALAVTAFVWAVAAQAQAQPDPHGVWTYPSPEIVEVLDGDTVRLAFDMLPPGPLPLRSPRADVRIAGVDAPERGGRGHAGPPDLYPFGRFVTQRAREWIAGRRDLFLRLYAVDGRGRALGDLEAVGDGQRLSDWLIEERLAVPWDGRGSRDALQDDHRENARHWRLLEDER